MGLPTFEERLVMQYMQDMITMQEFEDYLMECHRDGTIDQPCLYVGDEFPIG